MKQIHTVYMDVLFILNFLIDFLLLSLTGKLCGRKQSFKRIVLAAVIGGIGSLVIFLPPLHPVIQLGIKLLLSCLMILAAHPLQGFLQFVKEWFVFFIVNFLAAGILYGIFITMNPKIMTIYNGVVYFDISALLLIFNITIVYMIVSLFDHFMKSGNIKADFYEVSVCLWGKKIDLKGMVDTGNSLRDVFSDTPVTICQLEKLSPILPLSLKELLESETSAAALSFEGIEQRISERFRLIPYTGVHSGGLLPAFKADYMELKHLDKIYTIDNVYIAICSQSLGNNIDILLSPEMISIKTRRQVNV